MECQDPRTLTILTRGWTKTLLAELFDLTEIEFPITVKRDILYEKKDGRDLVQICITAKTDTVSMGVQG